MPDFERILRKLAIDMCDTEKEQDLLMAYHRGQDDARKQVAMIFGLIMALVSGLAIIIL